MCNNSFQFFILAYFPQLYSGPTKKKPGQCFNRIFSPLNHTLATAKSKRDVANKENHPLHSDFSWSISWLLKNGCHTLYDSDIATHTHRHPLNGPLSGTTRISRYQKGQSNLYFTEARHSEWQWHQLGHMQVCISLQTDNHSSTAPLSFYRPDALHAAQPQHLSTEGKKHGTFHKSACHLWARGHTDSGITNYQYARSLTAGQESYQYGVPMNESRLSRALAFFADTPKSAVSTTNTQELHIWTKMDTVSFAETKVWNFSLRPKVRSET